MVMVMVKKKRRRVTWQARTARPPSATSESFGVCRKCWSPLPRPAANISGRRRQLWRWRWNDSLESAQLQLAVGCIQSWHQCSPSFLVIGLSILLVISKTIFQFQWIILLPRCQRWQCKLGPNKKRVENLNSTVLRWIPRNCSCLNSRALDATVSEGLNLWRVSTASQTHSSFSIAPMQPHSPLL